MIIFIKRKITAKKKKKGVCSKRANNKLDLKWKEKSQMASFSVQLRSFNKGSEAQRCGRD